MSDDPKLLVVDDEEAICEGCRRIFTRQGFAVEKSSDANAGLNLASSSDYAAILLDIKMPTMDGIQFLEQLRSKKPDVPVILMTGYPSVPSAVSAIRLGAAAFVTKPFTPEEITEAVRKYARKLGAESKTTGHTVSDGWAPAAEPARFWHESWYRLGKDNSARVGAMLMRSDKAVESIRIPGIGEVVYQGLPMASLKMADGSEVVIPAPISGLVEAVNDDLAKNPAAVLTDPCGAGWIAGVCPTRLDDEAKNCTGRKAILFHADAGPARAQADKLAALGCEVRPVGTWTELAALLPEHEYSVLVVNPPAGQEGLRLIDQVNAAAPSMKVVVVAPGESQLEASYRARRIFYYAVEPFADNEIVDILNAAFPFPAAPTARLEKNPASAPLASISITNRNGTKVRMVAAPGLLRRNDGLGALIRQKLLERLFPMESTSGEVKITATDLARVAQTCDRLVVLLAKNADRHPGSLLRDTKSQFIAVAGEGDGKVTTLVVQPKSDDGGFDGLDARTIALLAEHIAADMASY